MNWTDEELDEGERVLVRPVSPPRESNIRRETVRALMTRAVELVAARGGGDALGQARREGFNEGHEKGAEAMRAACREAVRTRLALNGFIPPDHIVDQLLAAIDGATP